MVRTAPRSLAVLAAAGVLAVAGCGGSDEPSGTPASSESEAAGPSEITVALINPLPSMDFLRNRNRDLEVFGVNVYEPLIDFDRNRELQPILATDLPERIDPRTWRLKIREGVKFHNGEDLTADQVVESTNLMVDPEFNSEFLGNVETIEKAEKVDAMTVDFITKSPDELVPKRLQYIPIMPKAYFETRTEDKVGDLSGTGPYKWVSGDAQGPVVLERNDEYWGDAPEIEKFTIRVIPDLSTRLAALKTGEVDLVPQIPSDSSGEVPKFLKTTGLENVLLVFSSTDGVTKDPRVRQALTMAIDREALANDLFGGNAEVANCQATAPGSFGYNDTLQPYPYDPERAKQLLEEAGVAGKPVELIGGIIYNSGPEMAQAIAAYWEQVGVKVDLKIPEQTGYYPLYISKGAERPDSLYVSPSDDFIDSSVMIKVLGSEGTGSGYSNPEVDKLFEEQVSEEDPAKREEMLKEIAKIACDDAANANLIVPQDLYGASERLDWEPRFDLQIFVNEMSLGG